MTVKPFKIIICGGGPIGLIAAHALSKAGIDYVVLEQEEDVARDNGASIIVYQGTLRIMSQLGLLDLVRDAGDPFARTVLRSAADIPSYCVRQLALERENFGENGYIVDRARLLRLVYDALEDKSKVLLGKKATKVISDDDGVKVTCADGTTYEESIVIGADGIGSVARRAIRSLALKAGRTDVDAERPFLASYRMLWFSTPRPKRIVGSGGVISFGSRASVQSVCGEETCWFFLYERLKMETREKVVYTEKDMEDMMRRRGHLIADEGYRLDHLFSTRRKAGLINLDEGIVKTWSAGRIVLVGDAIHKFTPSSALGYNNGVQDVAILLNEIVHLMRTDSSSSVNALGAAFARYQATRTRLLHKDYKASAMATRSQTYDNLFLWVLCGLLVPSFGFLQRFLLTMGVSERLSEAWPLDFLPGTEPFHGKVPWKHPMGHARR